MEENKKDGGPYLFAMILFIVLMAPFFGISFQSIAAGIIMWLVMLAIDSIDTKLKTLIEELRKRG